MLRHAFKGDGEGQQFCNVRAPAQTLQLAIASYMIHTRPGSESFMAYHIVLMSLLRTH